MVRETANRRIREFEASLSLNGGRWSFQAEVYAGVDLGTAYIVTALVDTDGRPVAGMVTRSESSIRDGLVLDYVGAINILRKQIHALKSAGFDVRRASAAFPPGTMGRNVQAFGNVVRAVDLELVGLIDEPSAASLVLEITDGAVVDIGGGTTGISVIKEGGVVYSADEPTGGIHLDLVLAGHYRIPVEEAEKLKRQAERHSEVFPLVRPVFQKMAAIVRRHLRGQAVERLYLVGGTSCFPGIEEVMAEETGHPVAVPHNPLLVTPLGIAMECARCLRKDGESHGN